MSRSKSEILGDIIKLEEELKLIPNEKIIKEIEILEKELSKS